MGTVKKLECRKPESIGLENVEVKFQGGRSCCIPRRRWPSARILQTAAVNRWQQPHVAARYWQPSHLLHLCTGQTRTTTQTQTLCAHRRPRDTCRICQQTSWYECTRSRLAWRIVARLGTRTRPRAETRRARRRPAPRPAHGERRLLLRGAHLCAPMLLCTPPAGRGW